MFSRLTPSGVAWDDGTHLEADSVVWCTGFRPALRHLAALGLRDEHGKIQVGGRSGTQSLADPRVYLVGYGDWVGAASATLIGVGRTARATAEMIVNDLSGSPGTL